MKLELPRGIVLVAALTLASLACALPSILTSDESGPVEERPVEPAEPSAIETEVPEPTAPESEPESPGGPESLNLDDPSVYQEPIGLVDSYRVAMRFSFDGVASDGSPVSGQVQADGERTLNPEAMSMAFTGEGPVDLSGELPVKFSLIGGAYTIYSPETGCFSVPAGELEDPFALLIDLGGFLTGQAPRVRPDETVNGVPVYRYAIDASNVEGSELDVEEIGSGAIYVAKDGGYVVRLEMAGRGTSEMLSGDPSLVGDISYQLDYTDFNQGFAIVPPEECASLEGGASEYPMVEDASEVVAFGGVVSYNSQLEFESVVQFYKDQMPAAGWTLTDETTLGGLALLNFSGEGGTVLVSVTYDEGAEQVQVTILPGSE